MSAGPYRITPEESGSARAVHFGFRRDERPLRLEHGLEIGSVNGPVEPLADAGQVGSSVSAMLASGIRRRNRRFSQIGNPCRRPRYPTPESHDRHRLACRPTRRPGPRPRPDAARERIAMGRAPSPRPWRTLAPTGQDADSRARPLPKAPSRASVRRAADRARSRSVDRAEAMFCHRRKCGENQKVRDAALQSASTKKKDRRGGLFPSTGRPVTCTNPAGTSPAYPRTRT